MKLRNKKTGEIIEVESLDVDSPTEGIVGIPSFDRKGSYNSLAELNEEWEDYEEPKEYWFINSCGAVEVRTEEEQPAVADMHKQFGNYFETKEEAERAIQKLKAWKRLKDKGFRFDPVDRYEALCGNGFNIPITATMPPEAYTDTEVSKDLGICFGGEE